MLSGRRIISLVLNTICTSADTISTKRYPVAVPLNWRSFHSLPSRLSIPMASLAQEPVHPAEDTARPPEDPSQEPTGTTSVPDESLDALPKIDPQDFGSGSRERMNYQRKLKKCAILMGYSGYGFNGMQCNPDVETIESVLLNAMAKLDLIRADWRSDMQLLGFQRCARTDKGVSAAGQVISIPLAEPSQATIDQVNAELPPVIRLFGVKRTTRGFNAKNWCSSRTYLYMIPTMAFAPIDAIVSYDYRIEPERIETVNGLLKKYLGSNNFHNFTTGVKAWQDAAKRYMREITCSEAFVRDGIEFAVISVKGQSFMMHQIRKMVGLVVAIMRGHVNEDVFERVYGPVKVDVPKAPGLGLMLQAVHFDQYNQKFGKDGIHERIEWPECKDVVEQFKEEHIFPTIVRGEKEEKSMLEWLSHLPQHEFGVRDPEKEAGRTHSKLGDAQWTIEKVREREEEAVNSESGESDSGTTPKKKKKMEVV